MGARSPVGPVDETLDGPTAVSDAESPSRSPEASPSSSTLRALRRRLLVLTSDLLRKQVSRAGFIGDRTPLGARMQMKNGFRSISSAPHSMPMNVRTPGGTPGSR
jgi:hypothetical protein